MSSFAKFEEIGAWKKARELTGRVYQLTSSSEFRRDPALRDQIRRASVSVMLNIAEGFGRRTDREFRRYLAIANGSVTELQSALYIALDQELLTKDEFDRLYTLCGEIGKMMAGLRKYLLKG